MRGKKAPPSKHSHPHPANIHKRLMARWKKQGAFTLVELLIVIAIIAILAGIIFYYTGILNKFASAHDAERRHSAKQLQNAMYQHLVDKWQILNSNKIKEGTDNAVPICKYGLTTDPTCVNLDALVPTYLAELPKDIAESNANYTGYKIYTDAGRVGIVASHLGETSTIAAGVLSKWGANGEIADMDIANNILYIVGDFTQLIPVGGGAPVARTRLAAFDLKGNLLTWAPSADAYIHSIDAVGSTIYIGGQFGTVNSTTRNGFAAIDSNGNLQAWNPDVDVPDTTARVLINNNLAYIGGTFTKVKNSVVATRLTRNRVAAFTLTGSGSPTIWNPNANNFVHNIIIDNGIAYLGGNFTSVKGNAFASKTRNHVAAVTLSGCGSVTTWNPNVNSAIYGLTAYNGIVYMGGSFTTVGSSIRYNLAAVYEASGSVVANFDPDMDGLVEPMAMYGNTLYVGGQFTNVGTTPRNFAAAISILDGSVLKWDPKLQTNCSSDQVHGIYATDNRVYLGGCFQTVGGQNSPDFAELAPL